MQFNLDKQASERVPLPVLLCLNLKWKTKIHSTLLVRERAAYTFAVTAVASLQA